MPLSGAAPCTLVPCPSVPLCSGATALSGSPLGSRGSPPPEVPCSPSPVSVRRGRPLSCLALSVPGSPPRRGWVGRLPQSEPLPSTSSGTERTGHGPPRSPVCTAPWQAGGLWRPGVHGAGRDRQLQPPSQPVTEAPAPAPTPPHCPQSPVLGPPGMHLLLGVSPVL